MVNTEQVGFEGGTILGYPRIGKNRELKKALESFWAGRTDVADLETAASQLRVRNWKHMHELGLRADNASIPADFSYYDHILDTLTVVNGLPSRFDAWKKNGSLTLEGYFVAARGKDRVAPLEMTKWFDTNYHYLVPEIGPNTQFSLGVNFPAQLFKQGLTQGFVTRPYLVGPVTLLALAKPSEDAPADFNPLSRLDDLLPVYAEVLKELHALDAPWIQLDESALVSETLAVSSEDVAEAASRVYAYLTSLDERPRILLQASYADLNDNLQVVASSGVEGIALDLVRGGVPATSGIDLSGKIVLGGVVDGHNIWRADLDKALEKLSALQELGGKVIASSSTSLFHVPHTLEGEDKLPEHVRSWLAFADEKIREIVSLDAALASGEKDPLFDEARQALKSREVHEGVHRPDVAQRIAGLSEDDFSRSPYEQRLAAQRNALGLPILPTTTIGSFPQTPEIRKTRAAFARGEITEEQYKEQIREHISYVVKLQEDIDLDVLVHGEAERNDMVQYFAENFDGFDVTQNGWVQSYGSRCTRPSILWGDVTRPRPFTVEWISYAQSLTKKQMKGMLTGPVTILAWSFVRDDQPKAVTATQVALALRDEIADLEKAGIQIIQVDEPAIRELLPLKKRDQEDYLEWSVNSFRLATSGAADETQIHTHLCYSEFGQIFDAIDGLAADVTSVEAERSKMDIVEDINKAGYEREIGPGVYDIHSPRVPTAEDVEELLDIAVKSIPATQLWVNPDCGLKTRRYEEVVPALTNMVKAAKVARAKLQ